MGLRLHIGEKSKCRSRAVGVGREDATLLDIEIFIKNINKRMV